MAIDPYRQLDILNERNQQAGVTERSPTRAYEGERDARGLNLWSLGTITRAYSDTYTVDVDVDHVGLEETVPLMVGMTTADRMAGDLALPKVGTRVVVSYALGNDAPMVIGCPSAEPRAIAPRRSELPSTIENKEDDSADELHKVEARSLDPPGISGIHPEERSYGPKDPVHSGQGDGNCRGHRPIDELPGDWGHINDDGSGVVVLDGGGVVIKASDLSQIILNKIDDLVRVVGRNMEIFNDFGEVKFRNDDGVTYMEIKGGKSLEDTLDKKYTFKLRAGGGKEPFKLAITDGTNYEVAGIKITDEGVVKIFGADVVTHGTRSHEPGAPTAKKIIPAEHKAIGADQKVEIKGNQTINVDGSSNQKMGLNLVQDIGRNRATTIMGEDLCTVNDQRVVNVAGDKLNSPGRDILTYIVGSGSVSWDIGDPIGSAVIPFMDRGFSVKTYFGDIDFEVGNFGNISLKGPLLGIGDIKLENLIPPNKIILSTLTPDGCVLGGPFGIFHPARAEIVSAVLSIMLGLLDGHTHITPIGPTTPPIVPMTPIVGGLLPMIQTINTTMFL